MRLFVETPLVSGTELNLPPGAVRHAQVRRVQPGQALGLFDGTGLDWAAEVLAVTRSSVRVRVGASQPGLPELRPEVTLALAMPANERMDVLVEKACELGVARIQPLHSQRSVLRLEGERALRKCAHWQGIAQAASEQCGRAHVAHIAPVMALRDWLPQAQCATRWLLSLAGRDDGAAPPLAAQAPPGATLCTLSGPEGGLTPEEEVAARAAGFASVGLGARVLRAETAPLAVLAWLAMQDAGRAAPA